MYNIVPEETKFFLLELGADVPNIYENSQLYFL